MTSGPPLSAESLPGSGEAGSRARTGPGRPGLAAAIRGQLPGNVSVLLYAGVLYNTVLAAANAAGHYQSFASVAVVELVILSSAAIWILMAPQRGDDALPIFLICTGFTVAAFMSLFNQTAYVDCARNMMIVGLYLMVGSRLTAHQLDAAFRWLAVIVLVFLVVELVSTPLYVHIFQPASYYQHTRGVKLFSLDKSGLFRNALGFKGRMSFGLSSHRTSSIFIEQVSLANYAAVSVLYVLSRFGSLRRGDRLLQIGLIVLILLTNDTRTSLFLALLCLAGYFVFPLIPAFLSVFIMPLILSAGGALVAIGGFASGDDLRGRVSLTVEHLLRMDPATLFGLDVGALPQFGDTGYCYLIASFTVIGFTLFWLSCSIVVPDRGAPQRRCAIGLNLYIFINLMIGGTAIFSIKVAAPLWVLLGFMRSRGDPAPEGEGVLQRTADRPSSTHGRITAGFPT